MILSCLCRINVYRYAKTYSKILHPDVNINFPPRMNSLQFLRNHPAIVAAQWNRLYQTSHNSSHQHERISRQGVKEDQFAISHPRKHKIYERESQKDNLPEHWELIFTTVGFGKKIDVVQWLTFGALCILPFAVAFAWWEFEVEENVVLATVEVSKRTEFLLFLFLNFLICQGSLKTVKRLPKRIYLNAEADKYLAVTRSYVPWKTVQIEFKSTDILDLPSKKLPIKLKPWRDNEFRVKNDITLLPPMSFRSGYDYDWMMRNVRMPKNRRYFR